jgi:alpha-L-rhamnosidase
MNCYVKKIAALTAILLAVVACTAPCRLGAQQLDYKLHTSDTIGYARLKNGFQAPTPDTRLRCYWWWLNSMATKASITRDLEQMKAKGYGGASIVDAGSSNYAVAKKTAAGPVFMSPAWMELYAHAVKEAQRVGIELSVNVQSGWNPGGPRITPELALKKIVYTTITVQGGKKLTIALPQPEKKLAYADIAVQAFKEPSGNFPLRDSAIKNWSIKSFNKDFGFKGTYPLYKLREEYRSAGDVSGIKTSEIIDLTDKYINGTLVWEAPEGEWTIIRYGWTCTGARTSTNSDGWEGLSLDHLNPDAFKQFSTDVIEPLIHTAQKAGNSLHFLQTDSWEMGSVGWTNNFAAEFKKFRGYDIFPYLPVLAGRVVESVEQSDRFLYDYRKTIGDCVAASHYQLFSNLAHQYGLGMHPESGGPHSAPVDALQVMAISDFPQGEFWATANTHRIKDDERLAVKQRACVAHTNGKRFVAAEGPTSIGPQWERSPRDLKTNIDRVFCSGVNRIVWHTFTSSPAEYGLPGNEYFAGTHLNPNVTWWKQAGDFIGYLNRCSYLLSQGLFVADVLYYYGDDVPNFVFLKEEVQGLAFGHDWDKCSREALIKNTRVVNGNIVFPDGMQYRVLVLPDDEAIDLEVLRKVELLVKAGLTVVSPRPARATSLANFAAADAEVKAIAGRLWGAIDGMATKENVYGKGKVVFGKDVNTVLKEINVLPDLSFTSTTENTGIDYIHRNTRDMDIYFVVNRFGRKGINDFEFRYLTSLPDRYEQIECRFRVSGMVPELWNPMTGEIQEILTYREENGQTIVPLNLEPEGSRFVIFRKASTRHLIALSKDGKNIFPLNEYTGTDKPMLTIAKKGAAVMADLLEPGKYDFTWSDGKKSQQSLNKPNKWTALVGNWTIDFDKKWGGPGRVTTDTLQSWTLFASPGIKYYSGSAVYKRIFSVQATDLAAGKVLLDLGNVLEMASIKINGTQLPVRWAAPFTFDISAFAKTGNNILEVEVTNLWPNRLIGDSKLPVAQRITKTNVVKYEIPDADNMLRVSGLLGPVTLQFVRTEKIK